MIRWSIDAPETAQAGMIAVGELQASRTRFGAVVGPPFRFGGLSDRL
jgi:hypothetical protein